VDGEVCAEPGRVLAAGAAVELRWNEPGTGRERVRARQDLELAGLRVIYQDDAVIALDKPPGLLTDTASREQARERDSVKKRLIPLLRAEGARPHVVHRLDRDTSGVVLFARTEAAEDILRARFARHEPERVYLALVQGVPRDPEGTWEDWMAWDRRAHIQRPSRPGEADAVLASASWRRVEILGRCSLLEVRLHTGRRNQIRLHAQLRGHPLVGERLYVDPGSPPPTFGRQALHAARLSVAHPDDGRILVLESPLPEDLLGLLRRLRGA
jgi:23S rRNA pseudouridine1911/1915/1917 synthase